MVFSLFNRYVKLKNSSKPWKQPEKSHQSVYVIYNQPFIKISELVNPAFAFFLFARHSASSREGGYGEVALAHTLKIEVIKSL